MRINVYGCSWSTGVPEVDNGFHLGIEGCEIMAKVIFSKLVNAREIQ